LDKFFKLIILILLKKEILFSFSNLVANINNNFDLATFSFEKVNLQSKIYYK
jgi:hypothetical protein